MGVAVWYRVAGEWGMVKLSTIPATALHEAGIDLRQPPASLRACQLLAGTVSRLAEMACPNFSAALSKAQDLSGGNGEIVLANCTIAAVRMNRAPNWQLVTPHPPYGRRQL